MNTARRNPSTQKSARDEQNAELEDGVPSGGDETPVANRRLNCCRPTKSKTGSIFELLKASRTVQIIAPI